MADGDLLTANYQWQLHNTLYGTGNNGVHLENGKTIEGLGVPDAKTQDVEYFGQDGSYANPDYVQMRSIIIPAIIKVGAGLTVANVVSDFAALCTVWVPLVADTDLTFQLPGWGKIEVHGRPRGAKADLSLVNRGLIRIALRFDCPDPTITVL